MEQWGATTHSGGKPLCYGGEAGSLDPEIQVHLAYNRPGEEQRDGKKWRYTGKSHIPSPDALIPYRAI